jgi:hypothetical protein
MSNIQIVGLAAVILSFVVFFGGFIWIAYRSDDK